MPILLPPAIVVCEGYVFTRVCHSVQGGFCLTACWDTTPQEQTSPQSRLPTPPGADTPPAQSMLGDTVNARAVRILLECKLVHFVFAMPFKILKKLIKSPDVKINSLHQLTFNFIFTNILKIQIMKKIANR